MIGFYDDWDAFIWQLSPILISAIVITLVIFSLPRKSTPWQLNIVLAELLFLLIWNIEKMVAATRFVNGHSIIITILVCSISVGGIMLLWKKRQKTEREKKEALLYAIDQLTKEDLPALFSGLMDIEMTTHEMKETDFVWVIKKMLQQNLDQNKIITAETIKKLTILKTSNK